MSTLMQETKPGLSNPVHSAQSIFRQLLKAMSEPCHIVTQKYVKVTPEPFNPASYAIALTLLDQTTGVALTPSLLNNEVVFSMRFHTSSPIVKAIGDADFVFCSEIDIPDLADLNSGSETYPDQSCTLVIQCESFNQGLRVRASGPGIEYARLIQCSALSAELLEQRQTLNKQFPLGIDMIFTCGDDFFCLPRTTVIQTEKSLCM